MAKKKNTFLHWLKFSIGACLLCSLLVENVFGIFFTDIRNSYAEYELWNATPNGSLKFQFKTRRVDALLAYADDGGDRDFLSIELKDSRLCFKFRIADNGRTIYLGSNLSDSHYHDVLLIRNGREFTIQLDSERRSGMLTTHQESQLSIKSNLLMGGIPEGIVLNALTNPEVKLKSHLRGHIRNLAYRIPNNLMLPFRRPLLINSDDVNEDPSDLCSRADPCVNGGLCVSADGKLACNCEGTQHDGDKCENLLEAVSCMFDGNTFFTYALSARPIETFEDRIIFQFRTTHPNGLILHIGEQFDYITVSIKHGNLEVAVNLGSGEFRHQILPRRGTRFIDRKWHKVNIYRQGKEVYVNVDDVLAVHNETGGDFWSLQASGEIYVGGATDFEALQGVGVRENFRGTLRDVKYYGESGTLPFLEFARNENPFVYIRGNLNNCEKVQITSVEPVSFITDEAFLSLPRWEALPEGSISFSFRTNEGNGVIMYNYGSSTTRSDFFAFELVDGYLYLVLDLGSGSIRFRALSSHLDDSMWHNVLITRKGKTGSLKIDDHEPASFEMPGDSSHLNLDSHLILGGIRDDAILPMDLFSGALRKGFVGCIHNFVMEGRTLDLVQYIEEQGVEDVVRPYCRNEGPYCQSGNLPCRHTGICTEGWNRFICDCRMTGYSGLTCSDEVTRLSFNGEQYMRIALSSITQTKVEDFFFRFQTRFPDGLLVSTSNDNNDVDVMMVTLKDGRIELQTNFGSGYSYLTVGANLDDNKWHAVHVLRQDNDIMVTLDGDDVAEKFNISSGAPENFVSGILELRYIEVGGLIDPLREADPPPGFIGRMDQFQYNGKEYFDRDYTSALESFECSALYDDEITTRELMNPFTFQTKSIHVIIPTPLTRPKLTFFLQFRTTELEGLLLYSRGSENADFLAVELKRGHIRFIYNLGRGTVFIRDNTNTNLNDNRWHSLWIFENSHRRYILQVDGVTAISGPALEGANSFDLSDSLYVGGVPQSMYSNLPVMVESTVGFQGCLASLETNHQSLNWFETAISIENKEELVQGCPAVDEICPDGICMNGGLCIPGWGDYTCDCSITSFSGSNCSQPSISYRFGPAGGLITFELEEKDWVTQKKNELSLGFQTESENAVLMRIDSADSDDFIEMHIIRGRLLVVYNFGTKDHRMEEASGAVNDGLYHVVHFCHHGANASMKVDNNDEVVNFPRGRQATLFNNQKKMVIGGRSWQGQKRKRRSVEDGFEGVLSGINYNNLRPLDTAAGNDPRILIQGDVTRIDSPEYDVTWSSRAPVRTQEPQITLEEYGRTTDDTKSPTPSSHGSTMEVVKQPTVIRVEPKKPPKKWPISVIPTSDGTFPTDGPNIFTSQTKCRSGESCIELTEHSNEDIFHTGGPVATTKNTVPREKPTVEKVKVTKKQKPPIKTTKPPTGEKPTVLNTSQRDFVQHTGLIIGIIAACIILFIVLVLAFRRCKKSKSEGSYHINESRNYEQEATRASLLPQPQTNGDVPSKPKPKLPAEYATKEWYV